MRIRCVDTALETNIEKLAFLQQKCLPYDTPADVSKGWWWIATTTDDRLAGFAGLHPSMRWLDTVYLCRAGVMPDFRGNGLQKLLIRSRLRLARRLGYEWAITDTTLNPASSNSLVACGFRLFEPTNPWAGENSLYFRLRLQR